MGNAERNPLPTAGIIGDVSGSHRDEASYDGRFRLAAMDYVQTRADMSGGVVTRADLEAFVFEGEQVKLIDTGRGIRNPRQLPATITILTDPKSHYDDEVGSDGLLRYSIRTGEWAEGDNRKLNEVYVRELPVILLQKVRDAVFVPVFPVFIVGAEPDSGMNGRYVLQLAESRTLTIPPRINASSELERRYAQAIVKRRMHQPLFRAMVIDAYQRRCAVCALNHADLLDAAHITPDADEGGRPITSNGLALCKIHHAAYDNFIMGIRPDLRIHVATKVLEEIDGPMLRHGLQGFHERTLTSVPSRKADRPDPDRLEVRYAEFLAKAG